MGLDTTHDCWHGPYSQFMRWREYLCAVAGLPPLMLMEGFYSTRTSTNQVGIVRYGCLDVRGMKDGQSVLADGLAQCLPIRWSSVRVKPALLALLNHSDCDGKILRRQLLPLAAVLEDLAAKMPDDVGSVTGSTVYRRDGDGGLAATFEPHGKPLPERGCYDGFKAATLRFAAGCRRAHAAGENVEFH